MRSGRVRLEGDEARHAAHVLRIRAGETITVADGSGRVVDAVVTVASRDAVDARVILERVHRPPAPSLVLYQGVARRERMDLVIQKAVEVGARRIVPFLAQRTIVRWDGAKREKAAERWRSVATAAAKQCRSPWLTDVTEVVDGVEAMLDEGTVVVLHEEADVKLRDVLPADVPDELGVVVGPEGGLSHEEVTSLVAQGGVAVTLGERILRTETAGPVALALAGYAYGTLG